jgi:predicted nucleic acid-binding protein
MSVEVFVDTNILLYAHDRGAGAKHSAARELVESLWQKRSAAISTQVLQELSVNLRRKVARPLDERAVRDMISDYLAWHVIVNTGESVLEALDIGDRYGVSFWDALIIHAAQRSGAEILYSEDLSHGQVYGSVRVLDPLRLVEG